MVTSKWIYNIMHTLYGSIDKHKARFLERGLSFKEGVNYEDTFAPITRYTFLKDIIDLSSMMGWILHHIDVKTTFLNGVIEKDVYIEQHYGFVIHGKDSHVCRLKKDFHGLKQAPATWYARIDRYLMSLGLTKSEVDPNFYYKVVDGDTLILMIYSFWEQRGS